MRTTHKSKRDENESHPTLEETLSESNTVQVSQQSEKSDVETLLMRLNNESPITLEKPAFLMNCPFSYSTDQPNNAWMYELDDKQRIVDRSKALSQFFQLYNFLASECAVFLLPAPKSCHLQDLVFTANLGVVLEHLPGENIVILSNFTSEPRVGETEFGYSFFELMGCQTVVAPHKFEGDAELKHLYDNIYIGGERQTIALARPNHTLIQKSH